MPAIRVKVNRRAAIAIDGLSEADRQRLLQTTEQLQGTDPDAWPKDQVVRLSDTEPIYRVRFAPDLEAFSQRTPAAEIEILDLVRRETLEPFRSSGRNGGG